MTEDDVRGIGRAFDIELAPAFALEGGYSNESWLAHGPGDAAIVVRRYGRLNVTRSALFYEHAVMRHAAGALPTIGAPLAGLDGETLRLFGGAFVALLPYVAGETGSRDAAAPAAEMLAAFHRAMRTFRAARPRATRSLGTLAWLRDRFVAYARDPNVARSVAWNVAIDAVGAAASRVAPRVRGLPVGVAHGDPHPDNVVTRDGTVRALIDFDFTHETERAYDVATAADAYARDHEEAPLDIARFAAFARAYDAHLPLTNDEWAVLGDLAIRRSAMLVWYVVTRHGQRRPGDVGRAAVYVERLRELRALVRAETDLRAVS